MKLFLKIITGLAVLLAVSYFLGPKMKYESVNNTPLNLDMPLENLDLFVSDSEAEYNDIKPDNESRIIWDDGIEKTEYALLYLHGFEASWAESDPIISNLAERYGMNVFLPRISEQGRRDIDAMLDESPKGMIDSAKEAVAIAKLLGEKLIVFSCSTGSTYSTYLAANDPEIYAQIMTSPNFDLADQNSKLLTKPWGRQMLKQIIGSDYREFTPPDDARPYWNNRYRIEGLIALRSLIDQTMTKEIWSQNKTPIYLSYFYKNEEQKDKIISIPAIKAFKYAVQTPESLLRIEPISAGYGHVFTSKYMNDQWSVAQQAIFDYLDNVLKMEPRSTELSISN